MGILSNKGLFCNLDKKMMEQVKSFSCGNRDLDEFFQRDFIDYAESLFGKSYCFVNGEKSEEVICAFTVSNASIFTNRLPNARKKKISKEIPHQKRDLIYPAVLIGRLGINLKYQHCSVGTISFYKKNGFEYIFHSEEQEREYRHISNLASLNTRLMYFDLIRLVK